MNHNLNLVIGKYYYDGEGKRVKKQIYSGGGVSETTVFVYSNGKLIAEYSTTPPSANPTTSYTVTDQLGSPRVITNSLGEVISRRDFMPFGEEIHPDGTYRTSNQKYGASDSVRQRFTGYEKDTETGLDFAQARMYNNPHGRFTAIDPLLASGKSANPQTFNRYSYVMNSPLRLTDPTGLQAGSSPDEEEGPPIRVETQVLGMRWLDKLGFDLFGRISQMLNGGASPTEVYYKTGVSIDTIRAAEFSSQKAQDIDNAVQTIDFTGGWKALGASLRASTGQGSGRDALLANAELAANIFTLPTGGGVKKQATREIALGLETVGDRRVLSELAETTGASISKYWARDGITRRTVENNFGRAFHQATERATTIHFALDGLIDNIPRAVENGRRFGFNVQRRNVTNAELFTVFNDSSLFNRTRFYYQNRPVSPLLRSTLPSQ